MKTTEAQSKVQELRDTRRTRWNIGDGSRRGESKEGMYYHFFIGDLQLNFLPSSFHPTTEQRSFRMSSSDARVNALVQDGLSQERRHRMDISDVLKDFVADVFLHLLLDGRAFYEIVLVYCDDSQKPCGFQLVAVQPKTIRPLVNRYLYRQVWIGEKGVTRKERKFFRRTEIVQFRIPDEIGGPSGFRKLIDHFVRDSEGDIVPNFIRDKMKLLEAFPEFEANHYRRMAAVRVAKHCGDYGWTNRNLWIEYMDDFYSVLRSLKFERARALCREEIVKTLNEGLVGVGQTIGFSSTVEMDGITTSIQFEEMIQNISTGKSSLSEALEMMRPRY